MGDIMINEPLYHTAIHEAGHAAAHLWFQHPFKYVTIIPGKEGDGHLRGIENGRVAEILEYDAPTSNEERYIKHETIILIAGGVAEAKYTQSDQMPSGCTGDFQNLVDTCSGLGMTDDVITAYAAYIIGEAKGLFRRDTL